MEMHWNWPSHSIIIVSIVVINHLLSAENVVPKTLHVMLITQHRRNFLLHVCRLLLGIIFPFL